MMSSFATNAAIVGAIFVAIVCLYALYTYYRRPPKLDVRLEFYTKDKSIYRNRCEINYHSEDEENSSKSNSSFIVIKGTNNGPGSVWVDAVVVATAGRKTVYKRDSPDQINVNGAFKFAYTNVAELPLQLTNREEVRCVRSLNRLQKEYSNISHLGFKDRFGHCHWTSVDKIKRYSKV